MTPDAIRIGDRVCVPDRIDHVGTVRHVFERAVLITLDGSRITYCAEPERVRPLQ